MVFSAETPGLALDCGKLINWGIAPFGRVAQLVRAPASHAGGHRFESCRAHHA